jgi:Phosphate transport (Pho88)
MSTDIPAPEPPTPKLELKMLILPAVLFFSNKYVDFKNEATVLIFQQVLIAVGVVMASVYYYIYTRINGNKDARDIWVPPKPKPQLPFGLGPPAEPVKAEDYEKTTYKDYETKLIREAAQQVVMSIGEITSKIPLWTAPQGRQISVQCARGLSFAVADVAKSAGRLTALRLSMRRQCMVCF